MATWKLLLLGGAAASGKSTCGTQIARRLRVSCVSADSLWLALKRATTPLTHPELHHFEPVDEVAARGAGALCRMHIETANALTGPLDEFICRELKEGHDLVVEGAWITPEFAARRMAGNGGRAVFIHEPEPDQVLAAMMARQALTEPTQRQLRLAPMAWLYGNWLRDSAHEHRLPVVEARPRETLVERVLEAAA